MMKYVPLVIAILIATGCSTTPSAIQQIERAEKQAAERVKDVVSDLPSWYLEPPESTHQVVFVTGSSISTNIGMSRDKAIMDAQRQLGDQLDGVISSMSKSYLRDTGVGASVTTVENTEQVTKKVVAEANVAGYKIDKIVVQPEGRYFRTFVMLSYAIGELNTIRAMQEQAKLLKRLPQDQEKAFTELNQEVEQARTAE